MIVHSGSMRRLFCTVRAQSGAESRGRKEKSESAVESMRSKCRGVAQPGSAPALGAGGPRFKSARPDQFSKQNH